jgi:hypothetical protein
MERSSNIGRPEIRAGSRREVETLLSREQHLDELLDEALKDSFPASDRSSIGNAT